MSQPATYDHTQHGKLHWLLLAVAAGAVAGGLSLGDAEDGGPRLVALLVAGILVIAALSFAWLRVCDAGDELLVSFGPLPLLRRRVPYRRITAVARGRSLLLEGWGVHYMFGRGWTWNLWGRDTVVVELGDRMLRIGTDDPDGLVRFLEGRTDSTR